MTFKLLAAVLVASVASKQLPSVLLDEAEERLVGKAWWARVGDRVYHPPSLSLAQETVLSHNISDYYYALGSHSSLTDELQEHRVGGDGRVHLFHLPGGPAGHGSKGSTRREALSSLVQLQHGKVLSNVFGGYRVSSSYRNPLSAEGQTMESQVVSRISVDTVMGELNKLLREPTRSYQDPEETGRAVSFLQSELDSMGFTTCLQRTSNLGSPVTNVIAFLKGKTGSTHSVTLGAHYDSRPFTGAAPGAVDNGSGVAALLAIARALAANNVKTVRPVYLVAFAAEEPGCLGSQKFVEALQADDLPAECRIESRRRLGQLARHEHGSVHEAIIMDEIAWRSPNKESYPKMTVNLESYDTSKDVMDHLAEASRTHNGDAVNLVHNKDPFGSDHMSFLKAGFHAAMTIQGDDEAYPHYHTSQDDITQVNPTFLASVARMNAAGLLRLAGVRE